MLTITARNVNEAFPIGIIHLRERGVALPSRNGPVLEHPDPVSVKYLRPQERVLFDKDRAINPFLHFFEPLWILAGRNDVGFLASIVPRFKEYTDNGTSLYGAYGQRMHAQFNEAVRRLRRNPDDRQVVLMIREPADMWYTGKDQPCNLAVACKIRDGKLNIHVFNRSNDFIWGLAGANIPQFSVLQEYLASLIGCEIGTYHQTTDSMHVYTENPQWDKLKDTGLLYFDPYETGHVEPYPLFKGVTLDCEIPSINAFDHDLVKFFYHEERNNFMSPFFQEVVRPMWFAFAEHKATKSGMKHVKDIAASDWKLITQQWLEARE